MYHHTSTSSMWPQEKSGVVDSTLKVYGTRGLCTVDASGTCHFFPTKLFIKRNRSLTFVILVIPIGLYAQSMGSTYAIAENATDMIKAQSNSGCPVTFRCLVNDKSGPSGHDCTSIAGGVCTNLGAITDAPAFTGMWLISQRVRISSNYKIRGT